MTGAEFGGFILGLIVLAVIIGIIVWLFNWLARQPLSGLAVNYLAG